MTSETEMAASKKPMSSEAENHDDHMDVRPNGNTALPGIVVDIGVLTFIWRLDFSV